MESRILTYSYGSEKTIREKGSFWKEITKNRTLYLMTLPAIIALFLFCYLPFAGITIAFQDYNNQDGIFGSPFVGFENFKFFFTTKRAWEVTANTLILNTFFIITSLIFQIGFAILINEIGNKYFKKITQSLMFFPYFLSWVVIGSILYSLFSSHTGLINNVLKQLGYEPVRWYGEQQYWRGILVATHIWKWTGYGSIVYLAAMANFDTTIYEAAKVDGATKFQQIRHITLPLLVPTAVILTLFSIGRIFYGDFGMIYGIIGGNGILLQKTEVIDVYVFNAMYSSLGFKVATAIGLYQSVMGFILIMFSNRMAKKINDGTALF